MVASNKAGPDPIRFQDLTTELLAEAIRFCLTPQARDAAQSIARQMAKECGVDCAVEFFVRHLPVAGLTCDLMPQHTTRWMYCMNSSRAVINRIKVSNEAFRILLRSGVAKLFTFEP